MRNKYLQYKFFSLCFMVISLCVISTFLVLGEEIRYNGKQLQGNELAIYMDFVKAYETGKLKPGNNTGIEEKGTIEEVGKAFCSFWYDYPEVYWISNASYIIEPEIIKLSFEYFYNAIIDDIKEADLEIEKLVNQFSKYESCEDKIKAIHDYMAKNYEYGDNIAEGQCIVTGLLPKYGNCFLCQGYARLFQLLCTKLSIPCLLVDGDWKTQNESTPHAWNYVQMDDGKWYLMDVTFDHQHEEKDGHIVPLVVYAFYLIGTEDDVGEGYGHISSDTFQFGTQDKRSYPRIETKTFHISGDWKTEKPSTQDENGLMIRTCTICGKTLERKEIPKLSSTSETKNPATSTTGGKTVSTQVSAKTTKKTKKANTMTVKAKKKTVTVSVKTLKKKNVTIAAKKAFTVKKAVGKVTYKKVSGNKKITISKAGKITVKKKLKKGKYKFKVKVTAAGNGSYKSKSKTVTLTIDVK